MITRSKNRSAPKPKTPLSSLPITEVSHTSADITIIKQIFGIDATAPIWRSNTFSIDIEEYGKPSKRSKCRTQPKQNKFRPSRPRKKPVQKVKTAANEVTVGDKLAIDSCPNPNINNEQSPASPIPIEDVAQYPASPPRPAMLSCYQPSVLVAHPRDADRLESANRTSPMELVLPRWALHTDTGFDTRLFAKFCQPSLTDQCQNLHCEYPHKLPPCRQLFPVLRQMQLTEVLNVYNSVVCRCFKLIKLYFAAFATYFGLALQRRQLDYMIEHIEHPTRRLFYHYIYIMRGYCLTGLHITDSLKVLLEKRKSKDRNANRTMIMLMLELSNQDFMRFLTEFKAITVHSDCPLDMEVMRRLIDVSIERINPKFICIMWKVLKKNRQLVRTLKNERGYQKLRAITVRLFGHL